MQASDRLLEIEVAGADLIVQLSPIDLDGETIRIILFLSDGTNLRVTEQWQGNTLLRYSYYWLSSNNELIVGWDNAPHHRTLARFPHHKHVGDPITIQDSGETRLEDVLEVLRQHNSSQGS